MARPIEPTPILYGENAEEFLKKINEPPSLKDIAFMKEVLETFKDFDPSVESLSDIHTNQKTKK